MSMLNKVYGIDYNTYVCGGIGSYKLALFNNKTVLFYTESEMLECLLVLKKDKHVGEIKPFVSLISRGEYKI